MHATSLSDTHTCMLAAPAGLHSWQVLGQEISNDVGAGNYKYCMLISPRKTRSRAKWYATSMYLVRGVPIGFFSTASVPLLSHRRGMTRMEVGSSIKSLRSANALEMAAAAAMYSASHVDLATVRCMRDCHATAVD
eukprot:365458-Chlamydomonas_euryale.AAC.13